jgi:hypothetical protein
MGDATNWISSTFKVFEGLIGLRRPPQPDRSGARPSQDPAPEAVAVSPPDAILHPEPDVETDALPPLDAPPAQDDAEIESPPVEAAEALPVQEDDERPIQEDDESRRKLIRQLFNEYWTGLDDKPPTFAKRLEMAEGYINDRLADREVGWRLDAVTRKQLGLPSSSMDN